MKPKKFDVFFYSVCLLVALMPWILSRESFLGISFSETGQIGDTIGGITAPFVGLLGAYLVYKSFKAQIEANKILSKETTYNYVNGLLTNTITFLENSDYAGKVKRFLSLFGSYFSENSINERTIVELHSLNSEINFLLREIEVTYEKEKEVKLHYIKRVGVLFDSNWNSKINENLKIIEDFQRNKGELDHDQEKLYRLLFDIMRLTKKFDSYLVSKPGFFVY